MEATKNKQRCSTDCTEHTFVLQNTNGDNKYDATLSFCPKFRRDPYPPQRTIPEYNLDKRYFTNAFVLGTEKRSIRANTQQEQMHFQSMVKDACEKNNQIFFPRPNEKNSFCSVCKEHYLNYYEHIHYEPHREKIEAAIYNDEIKKLCNFYKEQWDGCHAKADKIMEQILKENEDIIKMQQKRDTGQDGEDSDDDMQDNDENENQMSNEGEVEGYDIEIQGKELQRECQNDKDEAIFRMFDDHYQKMKQRELEGDQVKHQEQEQKESNLQRMEENGNNQMIEGEEVANNKRAHISPYGKQDEFYYFNYPLSKYKLNKLKMLKDKQKEKLLEKEARRYKKGLLKGSYANKRQVSPDQYVGEEDEDIEVGYTSPSSLRKTRRSLHPDKIHQNSDQKVPEDKIKQGLHMTKGNFELYHQQKQLNAGFGNKEKDRSYYETKKDPTYKQPSAYQKEKRKYNKEKNVERDKNLEKLKDNQIVNLDSDNGENNLNENIAETIKKQSNSELIIKIPPNPSANPRAEGQHRRHYNSKLMYPYNRAPFHKNTKNVENKSNQEQLQKKLIMKEEKSIINNKSLKTGELTIFLHRNVLNSVDGQEQPHFGKYEVVNNVAQYFRKQLQTLIPNHHQSIVQNQSLKSRNKIEQKQLNQYESSDIKKNQIGSAENRQQKQIRDKHNSKEESVVEDDEDVKEIQKYMHSHRGLHEPPLLYETIKNKVLKKELKGKKKQLDKERIDKTWQKDQNPNKPPLQGYQYPQHPIPPYMAYYYPPYYNMQPRKPNQMPTTGQSEHRNPSLLPPSRDMQMPPHPPPFFDPRYMPHHPPAAQTHLESSQQKGGSIQKDQIGDKQGSSQKSMGKNGGNGYGYPPYWMPPPNPYMGMMPPSMMRQPPNGSGQVGSPPNNNSNMMNMGMYPMYNPYMGSYPQQYNNGKKDGGHEENYKK